MIGKTLGHYRITAPIGAGGMGEVYRATDTKLGREVALKMLPAEMAADPERLERFQREARTLAALNHPNIVTIFSVEESGITRFLAMELIEGETLDTIIAAGGLSLSRFLEISVPLADAISAAHERGIVHRDLKPGNVMVTREGRVKVLDFGLARLGGGDSGHDLSKSPTGTHADLTGEGQVFGTVAYMSPEQARGAVVDARSDVFSLGVVLYQMLTGERPFTGTTAVDIITSILRDKPPSVTDLRADLPSDVGRILRRCLEKVPRDRYQTSRDVYNELKELRADASPVSAAAPRSAAPKPVRTDSDTGRTRAQAFWIAVLPFTHSGADAELAAFAEGLSEDINAGLAKFPYLSVLSRNLTVRSNAQASDPRSVASQLGARYFLEGGIRKGGSALRINVQLVDAQTGAHVWAETYNRDLKDSDIFAVQDGISGRVVATVADSYGVLVHSMTAMTDQKADEDLAPSEWLFQYFAYRQQLSPPAHTAIKERLERAVERNPGQADLWACLAQVYTDEYAFGFRNDPTSLDRALAAARRAVELDRANQLGMVSLAQAYFFRQDLAAFRPAAEQAMALNRLNTDALGILGLLIVHTGEFERGAAIVRRGMELNPNHAGWFHFGPIWEHFHRGEYDRALEHAMQVNMPGLFWQPLVIAAIFGQLGRPAEAEAAVRDLLALDAGFAEHARRDVEVWHFASGLLEPVLEGVRKGGLGLPTAERGKVTPVSTPPVSGAARADQAFRVAVLPFTHSGAAPELEFLAEGLSEDINAGLAKFPYLSVISRSSVVRFKAQASDVRAVGRQLGARYVLEGGIRKSASALRIHVQLVDAQTGAHVWAETYNRELDGSNVLAVQDDVTDCVVASVADTSGALVRSMAATVEEKPDAELTASDCVLRHCRYQQRGTPDEHARVRSALEGFVEREPGHAEVWACLGRLYVHEFGLGFNPRPEPLDRALRAAQRAVDLDPTSQHARNVIAQVHFFRREVRDFRTAANHAIALNPRDTETLGVMGNMFTGTGDFERGPNLARRAMHLNPHHPDWFRFPLMFEHFQKGDYESALEELARVNMPGFFWKPLYVAACCGLLGRQAEGAAAVLELQRLDNDIERHAREYVESWLYASGLGDRFLDGLQKAGLEIAPAGESATPAAASAASSSPSGAARADEGFWVAVLPFKYRGTDAGLEALAEGLTEDIGAGLSRFSYLRVIARSSTSRYGHDVDVRTAGRELGARYVVEGNLRQVGAKLRVAVQLVDAVSGAHLWAESYERTFSTEAVFELQDDLVPRIVSTVADSHGVLLHTMSEAVRRKSPDQLSPYEAVLRGFGYFERVNAQELAAARSALELAVSKAPEYADAWAMLALLCAQEYGQGYSVLADSLAVGAIAAGRAVDAGPSNHLAHSSLAQVLFLQKDFQASRNAAARAVALNPMDGATVALMGILLAYSGEWERGCAVAEGAMRLNPHFPGWYRLATIVNAYRTHDYRAALDAALRIQMPGYFWTPVFCAAASGQLGEREQARKALRELLAIRPGFGSTAREEFGKWHEPELVEHFMDGLRKAGLDVPAAKMSKTGSSRPESDAGVAIAVLPFSDMSPAKDQDYLCEGMAEEIMNALVRVPDIRVASRTSSFRAREQEQDLATIARALNVGYVLEGSVRTGGDQIRVTAQLTNVATGFQLWSERFDRKTGDIFSVQDEITAGVVEAVKTRLAPGQSAPAPRPQLKNIEAYQLYLKGRHLRYSKNDHAGALKCFEEAVALDPSHGPSWVGLADVNVLAASYGLKPARAAHAAAKAALATAAGLQGESVEALYVEGLIACTERRWRDSERLLGRAMEIDSGHVQAHCWRANLLCIQGHVEEAVQAFDRAREIDPLAPYPYAMAGLCLILVGRIDEAERSLDQALAFDEGNILTLWVSGVAAVAARRFDLAISRLERALAASHGAAFIHAVLGWAMAAAGRTEEARRVLEVLRSRPAPATTLLPEAWMLAALGDRDGAFQILERAVEEHHLLVAFTGLPCFDGLRSDPRFPALRRRLGLSEREPQGPSSGSARIDEGFWIAVLPFKSGVDKADLAALAGGMSEEIVAGLSRFSYLRVITGTSTSRYAGQAADVREVGRELGARYVMSGSLRQVGVRIRVAVQLVDAATGAQLWAETYERAFSTDAMFELQDDLVSRIVSTVGDPHGVLPFNMSESLRGKTPDELTPYEAVLRSFGFGYRSTPEEHAAIRDGLERAVERAPDYSDGWAMVSLIYSHEFAHGFNALPDPLGRALEAARRAAALAPSSAVAYDALAWALFFRKEFPAFRVAAEESLALNSLSSPTLAGLGTLIAYSGDWEKGCALVERALQLNPRHPGWYRFALFADAYRKRDYRAAVNIALKINLPELFVTYEVLAAAYGQLAEPEEARKAVRELLRLNPDYLAMGRQRLEKWYRPDLVEHFIDGLRKAGLEIPAGAKSAPVDDGFWIAVLPFKSAGGDAGLATFAESLTSEIVTGLSRFSYLRVIARNATATGARYVMEGTLREAAGKLRLAVQIVDTASGAHLWAETYERAFDPKALFELQDDLVPRIVSTVADMNGALPRSLSEAVRGRAPEDLSPYEAVLRSFGYFERLTREELSAARSGLEAAVRKAPDHADAWAMLALLHVQDYAQAFGLHPDPLAEGATAARRAVDAAPSHPVAWFALAQALFFLKELESFRNAAERAVALNPMDGNSIAFLGEMLTYAGFEKRGMELAGRAKQLNPNHPGWYWYADFYDAYRQGDDRAAVNAALKVNMHAHIGAHFMMAAAYGQLGETKAAAKALGELLALKPDFGTVFHGMAAKWWNPNHVERLADGLRKAGLEIPAAPA